MEREDRIDISHMARDSVETRTWSAINQQLISHYKSVIDSQHKVLDSIGAVA